MQESGFTEVTRNGHADRAHHSRSGYTSTPSQTTYVRELFSDKIFLIQLNPM